MSVSTLASNNFHYLFKYIIIGDSAVGKSNLLLKYSHNKFNEDYQTTIGVEFGAKNLTLSNKTYRIQVWDTAGQENFRSITRAYYKNSVCAMVVYDITNRESFHNVLTWIEDCKNQCPKTVFLVLVGNKSDLEDKRKVMYNEAVDFANKNGMLFFETSAKNGTNVEKIFNESAREIAKKIDENYYDITNDACGIKQGIEASKDKAQLNNNPSSKDKKEKKCCE